MQTNKQTTNKPVMDMCNFHPNLHHQFKAYGGWSWAFKDYYAENITQDLDDQWFQDLLEAADPYSFFDRYNGRNISKFVVDGTWDEFSCLMMNNFGGMTWNNQNIF